MPPAVNQEINVNINALVKRIQDVKEFVATIKELRGQKSGPVVIDEKISANARAGTTEVQQLTTAIDQLTTKIERLDDSGGGRLSRLFTVLGGIATILGHLKSSKEGLDVLKEISGDQIKGATSGISQLATGVRDLFQAARQKAGEGITKIKETVSGLAEKFPALIRSGGSAAATFGGLGLAGAGAAIGVGALAIALGAVLTAILALIANVAVFAFLVHLASGAAEAGARLHDLSQESAVSVETLSALQPAIEQAGEELETVAGLIGKFNKLIGEANGKSDEAKEKLKAFGLEPQEALKNQEAALEKVFRRIHELPTPIEKSIAAQQVFGKSGAAMVKVIDQAGGSFVKAKEKAAAFGYLLSNQAAKDADEFGDSIDELKFLVGSLALAVGRTLIPELLKLLRIFTNEMPKAGGIFNTVLAGINFWITKNTNDIILLLAALKTIGDVPGALKVAIATGNPSLAVSLLADSFKNNLAALLTVANTPAADGGGSTGDPLDFPTKKEKSKKDTTPADTKESELAYRAASAQAAFDKEKDLIDRLTAIYQTALDDRKIRIDDFYEFTGELRARELREEIKLQEELNRIETERLLHAQKLIRADKETTDAQKAALLTNAQNTAFAALRPILERTEQLRRDLEDLPAKTQAAEQAALESLDHQITEFLARVDEANGRTAHAAAAAIDREFRELLERVTLEQGENSPLVQLIKEFIQAQKDRARVAQVEEQLQPLGQQFEIDRLQIETDVARQILTQKEGRRQINELQRQYLRAQLEILKAALAETQEARTQLELKLKIANVENALANLKDIDQAARDINDQLRFAAEDFFASLTDRTKSFKEAIADLGNFILQMFARLAAAKLVESLFGKVLGNSEGQGGIGGFLSGLFGGNKAAGDMMDARPGGQIIRVAEAGFDELVVSTDPRYAARTSALLGRFIERTGIVPNLRGFAAGGFARSLASSFATIPSLAAGALVPAAPGLALAGAGADGGHQALPPRVVIALDQDDIANASMSSAGEKVWLHYANKHRRRF